MSAEPPSLSRGALSLLAALLLGACAASPDSGHRSTRREELGPEVTLGIGAGGAQDGDAILGSAGVLAPVSDRWAVGGRLATYGFESSESGSFVFDGRTFDGSQTTTGSGLGLGGELRYYVGRALDGFWLGGGALYFPIHEAESTGSARERDSGLVFVEELEADAVSFLPYGALGWTFRGAGGSSWTLELDAGGAEGEAFAALTLRIGYGF